MINPLLMSQRVGGGGIYMAVPPLGWVNRPRRQVQNPDSGALGLELLKTYCVFDIFPGPPRLVFGPAPPCAARRARWRPATLQDAPKTFQDASKTPRNVPKTLQCAHKAPQDAPQDATKASQDAPGRFQDGPRRFQDAPQTTHYKPERPKTPP